MTVHVKTADEATLERVQEAMQALGRASTALERASREQRATTLAVYLSDLNDELDGVVERVGQAMAHLQKEVTR